MFAENPSEEVDLTVGTAMTLSVIPDPDDESLYYQQHLRVGSSLTTETYQQECQSLDT